MRQAQGNGDAAGPPYSPQRCYKIKTRCYKDGNAGFLEVVAACE